MSKIGENSLGYRNIIEANKSEREEADPALLKFLITFHNNGCGDQICMDTLHQYSEGEYPIVLWDHELNDKRNLENLKKVANNFAEWLIEQVKEEISYQFSSPDQCFAALQTVR